MGDIVQPEVSFIMPCYNEQDVVGYTIPQLIKAFEDAGHRLELVACDNGSSDRTSEIIHEMIEQGTENLVYHRVEVNEGYGNGVLETIPVCSAPWIGIIPADGQVDAEDVARLFEAVKQTNPMVLGKVRRRFRLDGLWRKVVSITYNGLVFLLWPRLGSIDVNGSPKIIHRDVLCRMGLESKEWLLDPEMMIKAHYMGVRVLEINVFARMRGNGLSHIRSSTCWEFFWSLIAFKFGRSLYRWRKEYRSGEPLVAPE